MHSKFVAMAAAGIGAALTVGASLAQNGDHAEARPDSANHGRVIVTTAAGSLTVVRDPDTGHLRAPTAEEAAALATSARAPAAARRFRAVAPAPRSFVSPSGAKGLTLGEDTLSMSVVRRNADGSLTEACVTGSEAAAKFLNAPEKAVPVSATTHKELPND